MNEAQKFLDKVDTDPALQAKLEAVGWKAAQASAIAAAAGFKVTAAELEAASNARYGQLSDSALDKVAGGSIVMPDARPPAPNAIVPDARPPAPNAIIPEAKPHPAPNIIVPD